MMREPEVKALLEQAFEALFPGFLMSLSRKQYAKLRIEREQYTARDTCGYDEALLMLSGCGTVITNVSNQRIVLFIESGAAQRNPAVAELELDDATGFIRKIDAVSAPEHLPVGVPFRKGTADRGALNDWWGDRSIPASRSGVQQALETLDIPNTKLLLLRCYGLSLSDQYWICPRGSGLTWGGALLTF